LALRSALRAAAAGLLPVPHGAFRQEPASGGGPTEPLQVSSGREPPQFISKVIIVRGAVAWDTLRAGLSALEPVASGHWSVEELGLDSLVARPEWAGEAGYASEQAALEAGRTVLRRDPSLLLMAPGFRSDNGGGGRSAAWPRGRIGISSARKAACHVEDLGWAAIAGLLDAVVEAAASDLPTPSFVLLLPEPFATASGRARLEPFYEARLEAMAKQPGISTGAFYQCAWAAHSSAAYPLRIITNLPFLVEGCVGGLPFRKAHRGARGDQRFSYHGPLPGSCSCGRAHPRRTSDAVASAEPLEPGTTRQLVARLEKEFDWRAAGPSALVGGELAACTLLAGPPCRGPPVAKFAPVPGNAGVPWTCTLAVTTGMVTPFGATGSRSVGTATRSAAAGATRRLCVRMR